MYDLYPYIVRLHSMMLTYLRASVLFYGLGVFQYRLLESMYIDPQASRHLQIYILFRLVLLGYPTLTDDEFIDLVYGDVDTGHRIGSGIAQHLHTFMEPT